MEYFDEEVLKFRNAVKKSSRKTLEEGMYIENELIAFQRSKLFDGKMSIMLPEHFFDLPSQMARIKYPSENRPQIIKTSPDTTVNFTFSLLPDSLQEEEIMKTIEQFKLIIQRIQPSNVFYEMETDLQNKLGWFSFKSYAIDEKMYNLVYIKIIEGKLMHGIFNCMFRDMEEWKDAALLSIQSIIDHTQEEEEAAT